MSKSTVFAFYTGAQFTDHGKKLSTEIFLMTLFWDSSAVSTLHHIDRRKKKELNYKDGLSL